MPFWIRIFLFLSFFLNSFGIETINTFVHSHSSLVNYTRFQTKSLHSFSHQNGQKTLPFRAAHTYMAYIREYPPPRFQIKIRSFEVQSRQSWQLRFEVRKLILYWLLRNVVPNFPTSQTLRGEVMRKRLSLMLPTWCVLGVFINLFIFYFPRTMLKNIKA